MKREWYATIKKEHAPRYYEGQQEKACWGEPIPFPVTLEFDHDPEYPVHGGIGGRYMLYHVNLYYKNGNKLEKTLIHEWYN
jgi:hypothetical protein